MGLKEVESEEAKWGLSDRQNEGCGICLSIVRERERESLQENIIFLYLFIVCLKKMYICSSDLKCCLNRGKSYRQDTVPCTIEEERREEENLLMRESIVLFRLLLEVE